MTTLDNLHQSRIINQQGMLLVHKPAGITSHAAVQRARKIFQTSRIGHCGTLDPFSEGLLLLLIGETVSLQHYFMTRSKVYRALFKIGITTDTLDPTGEVTRTDPDFEMPSRKVIQEVIESKFIGEVIQIPPIYSAIKVGGKRAYALARAGKQVTLPERRIQVSRFEILSIVDHEIEVRIECSSGTYIRTLAQDLAASLGSVGMVESLIREKIGSYPLSDAIDLERCYEQGGEKIAQTSFEELHKDFPGIIPLNLLLEKEGREKTAFNPTSPSASNLHSLRGISIHCSKEELHRAKNGNFSFSLIKRQDGLFFLVYKSTVLMIVEKKSGKTRILLNLLKHLDPA